MAKEITLHFLADEFAELVWENGQILMRGRSTCPKIYTSKKPRLRTENNIPDRGDLFKNKRSVQDDHHSDDLFPGSYKNDFNIFLGTTRNNTYDEHLTESQIVPECEDENFRLGNDASPVEIPQITKARKGQLYESSSQRCQASVSISRSIATGSQSLSSMGRLPNSNLQQLNSRTDKDLRLRNFSLFLRPAMLSKVDDQHQGATEPADGPSSLRVQGLKSNQDKTPADDTALVLESTSGSGNAKDFYKHQDLVTVKTDQIQQIAKTSEESPQDEQSEAPDQRNAIKSKRVQERAPISTSSLQANTVEGNPDREKSKDQLAVATSLCSWGASNDLSYSTLRRNNKDKEAMVSSSETDEGDQQVPKPAFAHAGAKRKRREVHKKSERKRRDKITKKMRALQALLPNSTKVDKVSVLDNAIEYLKTLQLQLQIMSQGTSFCMPPMIVGTGMQPTHIQATNLAHFPTMGLQMDTRIPMGVGCNPAMFSNPAMLVGVLPMPFIPPVSAMPFSGAATPLEFARSAPTLRSNGSIVQNNNSEND